MLGYNAFKESIPHIDRIIHLIVAGAKSKAFFQIIFEGLNLYKSGKKNIYSHLIK